MKILIADKFQEAYLGELNSLGHEITLNPDLKADDLPNVIKGYEGLIVRSTKVTKDTIIASDALSLVIRAGAGVNTIDVEAAAEKGIFVCNTPGKNSVAVAELAFGLLLSIDRKIPDNVIDLKAGKWNKKKYSKADGVCGKTVGIIGLGDIGLAFADRAHAFGMKVLAFRRTRTPELKAEMKQRFGDDNFKFCESVEELVKDSDVVTIHLPSNAATKGMVNKDFLNNMKESSILINTSRGNVVDDAALIKAMNEKNIRVGLDVYNDECATATGDFATELSQHSNVYGTHHVGASTEQAQNAIAGEVIEVLKKFVDGTVLHPVNIETVPVVKNTLMVRIYDGPGVLASISTSLKEQNISIQQLESRVFVGGKAQQIIFHLNKKPDVSTIEKIKNLKNIIQVTLKTEE